MNDKEFRINNYIDKNGNTINFKIVDYIDDLIKERLDIILKEKGIDLDD